MTSLVPPNATILPVDTRYERKTLILPDVATNPGRYLVVKDVYGNASRSTILFSTLTGNYFEQSWTSTYIGSQAYGAWHLMNDGQSRWLFTSLYDGGPLFYYQQTNIVTRGLFYNLLGNNYTEGGGWTDTLNQVNLSSGIAAAAPHIGLDAEFQTIPSFLSNDYFRGFTPIPLAVNASSYTYSLWLSSALVGCLLNEAQNPSTFVSSVSQAVCCLINTNTFRAGFRNQTGGANYTDSRFTPGQWINATWTLNFSTHITYINGSTTGTFTNNRTYLRSTFENSYLTVGLGSPGWNLGTAIPFRGLIGAVRFYSTVLTPAEVLQNYNAEAYRYGYGLNQR
jgi:hypothetical protein